MNHDSSGLEILGRAQCLALMRTAPVGRIVFTDRALPAIMPVNFALDGDNVIIRTAPGSKLAAATRDAIVAFETDRMDPDARTGWSVTAIGQATPVDDPAQVTRLANIAPRPWTPEPGDHIIRVAIRHISGRRFPPAPKTGDRAA